MTTCTMSIGAHRQYKVRVDAADVVFLTQWKWSFKRSVWPYGVRVYACRCVWHCGRKSMLYMHTVILAERMGLPRPSAAHSGDHRDIDSLNNSRANLRWATRSQQSANQRRRISKPERVAHAVAAAGCARTTPRKSAGKRLHKGR